MMLKPLVFLFSKKIRVLKRAISTVISYSTRGSYLIDKSICRNILND